MIKNAREMRETTESNDNYKVGFEKAVESVMKAIERASAKGYRETCFNPSAYWYETDNGLRTFMRFDDEVKNEFKKHGYTFKPTGYIGGVWQRTEQICW